jgi:hypothetical protein
MNSPVQSSLYSRILSIAGNMHHREAFHIGSILVISLMLIFPIFYVGTPENYDLPQHLRFMRTYFDALSSGTILPIWGGADNAGLGSAGVRFYPPLVYLVMGGIQFLTGNWADTISISILLWMFIGCVGVYYLAKEYLPANWALLAALLFAFTPYRLVQVYQAFLLAEFAALAILPFCLLFASKLMNEGRWRHSLLFAVTVALLVITHIPSTIIGCLAIGIFVVSGLDRKNFLRSISRFAVAGIVSLAATSFHWVRLLSELSWVKHNTPQFYGSGFYDYSSYFFPLYFSTPSDYVALLVWMWDIVIVLTLLLFIPAGVLVLSKKFGSRSSEHRRFYGLFAAGVATLLLTTSLSTPLWDNVPPLQKIQFPWRFLGPASLVGSIVFTIAARALITTSANLGRFPAYALALTCTAILVFDFTQSIIPPDAVPRETLAKQIASLDEDKGCECWWPIWAKEEAFEVTDRISASGRSFSITAWDNSSRIFVVEAGEPIDARIATFYYPHWRSEVNGIEVPVGMDENGTITIPLTSETSDVRLYFREPSFLRVAKNVSLIAWLGIVIVFVCSLRRKGLRQMPLVS